MIARGVRERPQPLQLSSGCSLSYRLAGANQRVGFPRKGVTIVVTLGGSRVPRSRAWEMTATQPVGRNESPDRMRSFEEDHTSRAHEYTKAPKDDEKGKADEDKTKTRRDRGAQHQPHAPAHQRTCPPAAGPSFELRELFLARLVRYGVPVGATSTSEVQGLPLESVKVTPGQTPPAGNLASTH
jgi:hypothetical protein